MKLIIRKTAKLFKVDALKKQGVHRPKTHAHLSLACSLTFQESVGMQRINF